MNQTISTFARNELKAGLSKCSETQQLLFKRIYSYKNIDLPINDVVDQMPNEKLDWAMQQVEKTIAVALTKMKGGGE